MRHGFSSWVGKVFWRRAWQPTPVFLLRESHGQRRLVGLHGITKSQTRLNWLSMHGCILIAAVVVQSLNHIWLLRTDGLQHARLPCPSPIPRACSHPMISSSVAHFCLQSFSASKSFPMNRLFASGGQNSGASASASVLPMNIQGWFPLGLTGLISLLSEGLSRAFSSTTIRRYNSSAPSVLYRPALTSIHDYWKNHSFD